METTDLGWRLGQPFPFSGKCDDTGSSCVQVRECNGKQCLWEPYCTHGNHTGLCMPTTWGPVDSQCAFGSAILGSHQGNSGNSGNAKTLRGCIVRLIFNRAAFRVMKLIRAIRLHSTVFLGTDIIENVLETLMNAVLLLRYWAFGGI